MALVVNKQKEFNFVPFSQRGEENPFTVVIKPLDAMSLAKLQDGYISFKDDEAISLQQGTYNIKALKCGLISWKGLIDDEGKETELKKTAKGEVTNESLSMLPPTISDEIANAIISITKFPESANVLLGLDA